MDIRIPFTRGIPVPRQPTHKQSGEIDVGCGTLALFDLGNAECRERRERRDAVSPTCRIIGLSKLTCPNGKASRPLAVFSYRCSVYLLCLVENAFNSVHPYLAPAHPSYDVVYGISGDARYYVVAKERRPEYAPPGRSVGAAGSVVVFPSLQAYLLT